jgi:hypothetical protein
MMLGMTWGMWAFLGVVAAIGWWDVLRRPKCPVCQWRLPMERAYDRDGNDPHWVCVWCEDAWRFPHE